MLNRSGARRKFVWTGRKPRLAISVIALVIGMGAPVSAQIYSWRDANGNLVLSNRRPAAAADVRTYSVPETAAIRTTRYVAATRGRLYDDLLTEHARLNRVRPDLVKAVVQVESGFNPTARSAKGALGLMQLMPATIRDFGVRNPFNPVENVRAGVAYLRRLLDRYEDNETLALAAYNAGPGAVDRHGQSVPPYRETREYVTRVSDAAGHPIQVRGGAIYKSTDVVNGREVPLYSDHKPTGAYQVVR